MSFERITSTKNPRVKAAAKLRDRGARRAQGRIIVDGIREISRALDAGVMLREAFICRELCDDAEARALECRLAAANVELTELSPLVFEKLAYGERLEGIVAIAQTPATELARLKLPADPLVAVLEGIEKPGNIGAVLRSADAAGVSAVVLAGGRTDLFNPNVIRASLGTVFTMPVAAAEPDEVLQWLRLQRLKVVAARVDASRLYTEAPLAGGVAIVLGAEAEGLSEIWRCDDVLAVRLPMLGVADSLNIASAAAVLFFEALRQRTM